VLGAILLVTIDQIVRPFALGGWRSPVVILSALIIVRLTKSNPKAPTTTLQQYSRLADDSHDTERAHAQLMLMLTFVLLLARGDVPPSRLVAVFPLLIAGLALYRPSFSASARFPLGIAVGASLVSIALAAGLRPPNSYGGWRYEPLYFGTDDLIFSEALSNSVSSFGPGDNPAAFGTPLRYHWLSMAWSGLMGRLTDAEPLISTLHLVPTLGYVMMCLLLCGIVREFTASAATQVWGMAVLFVTSYSGIRIRFMVVENTSNIIGHVWLLAGMLALIFLYREGSRISMASVVILLAAVLMTKPHYALPLILALVIGFSASMLRRRLVRNELITLLSSVFALALAYLFFLRPNEWEQRKITLSLHWLGLPTGGIYSVISPLLSVSVTLLLVGASLLVVFGVPSAHDGKDDALRYLAGASLLTALASLAVFRNGSEEYLIGAALCTGAPIAGIYFGKLASLTKPKWITMALLFSVSLVAQWWILRNWGEIAVDVRRAFSLQSDVPESVRLALPLIVVTTIGVVTFVSAIIRGAKQRITTGNRSSALSKGLLFGMISLLGLQIGAFFGQMNYGGPHTQVAETQDRDALEWIRLNKEPTWRIATNRDLCIDPPACSVGGSSFLISAFTGLPVLIEGPRFVVGGQQYPTWVRQRISASLDFAQSPSFENRQRLVDFGVTHFYFDDSSPPGLPDLEVLRAVGTVVYSRDSRVILDLSS